MFVVTYNGKFGFIKPWTAVRDGETFSQQFLTPSIIEGIEKKLFPELLSTQGVHKIIRHKLSYEGMDAQQEVTQTRGWEKKGKMMVRNRSILVRDVLLNPVLHMAFEEKDDAVRASTQHICLCRNEDILMPEGSIRQMSVDEFSALPGFELRFGNANVPNMSFLVGYNRFDHNRPMYGWIEYGGKKL